MVVVVEWDVVGLVGSTALDADTLGFEVFIDVRKGLTRSLCDIIIVVAMEAKSVEYNTTFFIADEGVVEVGTIRCVPGRQARAFRCSSP